MATLGTTAVRIPSERERQAFLLRRRQGLSDSQIAGLVGASRETINRRINRFQSKVRAIRLACPGDCSILEQIFA